MAAAKCRQNRQNQIEDLKARRKLLEDEGTQTRQLIDNLKHEKKQIEELLKKHAVGREKFALPPFIIKQKMNEILSFKRD